ncbi:MAG: hypothetical protein CM1200mP36_04780 [Gammaproteobacteria bacterium]|nr:MAG: hypothetical protein CM1200mP36_04780 [Gammaproteobacteria bacterium]
MMVRCIVFCGEQGVPYTVERDEFETSAVHSSAYSKANLSRARARRYFPDYAKLERIAVLRPYRKRGIGSEITRFPVSLAQERGTRATE